MWSVRGPCKTGHSGVGNARDARRTSSQGDVVAHSNRSRFRDGEAFADLVDAECADSTAIVVAERETS